MIITMRSTCGFLGVYARGTRGAAAAEFALIATVMSLPLLNVIDVGSYIYSKMEMQNATQTGAQEAWLLGTTCTLPLTKTGNSCAGTYANSIKAAVHGGSLGPLVCPSSCSINEVYGCVNGAGNLVFTAISAGQPTCSDDSLGGDYVQVTGTYAYRPMVSGVSVTSLLTTPISYTATMRID
jgi:Flp pilus assembly pilin Flp